MPAYKESLPELCPPREAIDSAIPSAYRFVASERPDDTDFLSLAALGESRKGADPCRLASTSLFTDIERVESVAKISKVRAKCSFIEKLSLPCNAGRRIFLSGSHVDFWAYAEFAFKSNVSDVVGISDG